MIEFCFFISLGLQACHSSDGAAAQKDVNESKVRQILTDNPERLPLGDGKISDAPRKGYVWSCQKNFGGDLFGIGAFRRGEWIYDDGTWNTKAKTVEVDGDVLRDDFCYEMVLDGDTRRLIGNGLPNHRTGVFPVQPTDDAYNYDRNPNRIEEYQLIYNLPRLLKLADAPACVPMGAIGVMKSGAVIFNALDAEAKDAVAHEIQDKCSGHPEVDNHYHYHNLSKCIEDG